MCDRWSLLGIDLKKCCQEGKNDRIDASDCEDGKYKGNNILAESSDLAQDGGGSSDDEGWGDRAPEGGVR